MKKNPTVKVHQRGNDKPRADTYYTLAVFEDGHWVPEFGDYSRAVVDQELRDVYATDSGLPVRIFVSGDAQAEIDKCLRFATLETLLDLEKQLLMQWSNAFEVEIAPSVDAAAAGHVDHEYWIRSMPNARGEYLTDDQVREFRAWVREVTQEGTS